MDYSQHQDSLLEISESERQTMLLSNNLTDIFQSEHYKPSMTISRVSQIDKGSEDMSNTTHVRMVHTAERLAQEINKNQLLENKLQQQEKKLQELQEQLNSKELQLQENIQLCEKLQKSLELEQELTKQQRKRIKEMQFNINSLTKQIILKNDGESLAQSVDLINQKSKSSRQHIGGNPFSHSYNSSRAHFSRIATEEHSFVSSQKKDKSQIQQKLLLLNARPDFCNTLEESSKKQKYYRSQSNFWGSITTSPNPDKNRTHTQLINSSNSKIIQGTEKKIENTLSLLKQIKMQCNQFTNRKYQ